MAPAALPTDVDTVARLRLAVTRLNRRLRQQSSGNDVTPSQLSVMATLEREGAAQTLSQLASLERVQPPTMTRVVASLEQAGLVRRTVSEDDRRFARVELTPQGRQLIKSIRRRKDAWLARRLAELTPAEVAEVERVLPLLERLLEADA
jgi:DNA-binding MarR family transcriptional regulator